MKRTLFGKTPESVSPFSLFVGGGRTFFPLQRGSVTTLRTCGVDGCFIEIDELDSSIIRSDYRFGWLGRLARNHFRSKSLNAGSQKGSARLEAYDEKLREELHPSPLVLVRYVAKKVRKRTFWKNFPGCKKKVNSDACTCLLGWCLGCESTSGATYSLISWRE